MDKKELKAELKTLANIMYELYMKYLDSLEDEGNVVGKEEGYLDVTIWRESIHINSTVDSEEMKKEHQIDFHYDK